jgi:DNA-binding HxlR family transcriptional regulator
LEWNTFFKSTDVSVLNHLQKHDDARYSELLKAIGKTRGALARSLRDLRRKKLIERTVEQTDPIQTRYRLTDKGREAVRLLNDLEKVMT